jgi:hypothetical protein
VSYSIAREMADTPIPVAVVTETGMLMVSPGKQFDEL